jgi:hypothetical protein
MEQSSKPKFLAVFTLYAALGPISAYADTPGPCLLTKEEFAQGKPTYSDPGLAGSSCSYEDGVIYYYSGPNAQAPWESILAKLGEGGSEKVAVEGIGDSAYAFYAPAPNKYVGAHTVIGFSKGEHRVVLAVEADDGQPGQSVHDKAVTLARLAADKLK